MFWAILLYNIINTVINISQIILSAFIIIEFDPPIYCFKTVSHIKRFRMCKTRALN